jgi:hypothetical protein
MAGCGVVGQAGAMSGLRDLMEGYLATRRALGFKLVAPEKTLDAFVGWMEEAGEPAIRRDLATAWASRFSRGTVLERQNYVRQFAEHVAWFDPATEVPVLDGRPYGADVVTGSQFPIGHQETHTRSRRRASSFRTRRPIPASRHRTHEP